MPALNEERATRAHIMVIDDHPANLRLLEEMLEPHYEVRCFPRGLLALKAAESQPPDLILLDINMPGMNGFEVCERLKATPALRPIPVIFLSALRGMKDKVAAFRAGGADYVCKPFQLEEVHARIEVQLKLRRAQAAEKDLLERTLNGAIAVLLQLLQVSSPQLVLRTHSLREIVTFLTRQMGVQDAWQYELAALLSLVGWIVLPEELFSKAYAGARLSPEEEEQYQSHPELAAKLIGNIPRLDVVAEMIRGQLRTGEQTSLANPAKFGAHALYLATELDRRLVRNISVDNALAELERSRNFNPEMLEALSRYSPRQSDYELRRVAIRELQPLMIADEDIRTIKQGTLLLQKGSLLTDLWIERIKNFMRAQGIKEPLQVMVPVSSAKQIFTELPVGRSEPGQPYNELF